jgi:hypothetical protein
LQSLRFQKSTNAAHQTVIHILALRTNNVANPKLLTVSAGSNRKTIYFILIMLLFFVVLFFKDYRIANKHWKYGKGFHIGDFVAFDSNYFKFFNDTLYEDKIPVALLLNYKYRIYDDIITIESLDRKEKGTYFSK